MHGTRTSISNKHFLYDSITVQSNAHDLFYDGHPSSGCQDHLSDLVITSSSLFLMYFRSCHGAEGGDIKGQRTGNTCTQSENWGTFVIIIIIIIIIISYDVLIIFGFCRLSVLPKLCVRVQWLTRCVAEKLTCDIHAWRGKYTWNNVEVCYWCIFKICQRCITWFFFSSTLLHAFCIVGPVISTLAVLFLEKGRPQLVTHLHLVWVLLLALT
jgi:hypothetical protein